jgi:outer membrane protein TolC
MSSPVTLGRARLTTVAVLVGVVFAIPPGHTASADRGLDAVEDNSSGACNADGALRPIELADAVAASLQSEPRLIIAQQEVIESQAAKMAAVTAFLPSVQLALTDERYVPSNGSSPVVVVGNSVLGGPQTKSAYGSLNLSWNISNSGRDIAAFHGAQAGVRAASSGLVSQLEDTLTGILQAHADLYEAEVSLRGEASAVAGLQAILSRADERFRNGHGTTVAIGQARSAELDAEQSLNRACRAVADKSAALAQAVGIRIDAQQRLSASAPLPLPVSTAAAETDLDGSIESSPAVVAAQDRIAEAQAKLRQANRAFGPTVSFSVRRDYLGQDPDSIWDANHHIAPNDYRVALSVEQPLFPLLGEAEQVKKARAELRKAQAAYEQARLDSQTKLRGALSAQHEAEASYLAAKSSLAESERVLSLTQSLLRAGRTDLDNVQRAQMDRDKVQTDVQTLASKRALAQWVALRALQPTRFPDLMFEQLHLQPQAQSWRDGDQSPPAAELP